MDLSDKQVMERYYDVLTTKIRNERQFDLLTKRKSRCNSHFGSTWPEVSIVCIRTIEQSCYGNMISEKQRISWRF